MFSSGSILYRVRKAKAGFHSYVPVPIKRNATPLSFTRSSLFNYVSRDNTVDLPRPLHFMYSSHMFSKVRRLLELVLTNRACMFIIVNLRYMAKKAIPERETLIASLP